IDLLAGGAIQHPYATDVRVVESADGQRDDVRRGRDRPVLPSLGAPPAADAAPHPVRVDQRIARPADRRGVLQSTRCQQRHRRGDLVIGRAHRTLRIGITVRAPSTANTMPAMNTAAYPPVSRISAPTSAGVNAWGRAVAMFRMP